MQTKADLATYQSDQVKQQATRLAEELRRLADQIDHQAASFSLANTTPGTSHVTTAARILHTITWGIANASPERLVIEAGLADTYHIEATTP